ncbi:hypothetical protein BYT27DRAFT_7163973 [Phlegmacium glaucopus]|nr:hypothetical protein BYT27DRAFT_7163973 [Phlegmacium glaucopus]
MYDSFGPQLTNNPFITDSSHPSNRYPDISTPPTQSTWNDPANTQQQYQPDIYHQYTQQQQIPLGYAQQQQAQNYPPPYQQSQLQLTPSFQPNSSFGQNLQTAISGSGYGYLQQGQQQPQLPQNAYNPAQQQLQNNPGYIAQFDPYGPISQGWADTTSSLTQSQSLSSPISPTTNSNNNFGYGNSNQIITPSGPAGFSPSGDPHPREYIRSHRQEIEAWDSHAWKQLLNTFEGLKKAWEARSKELRERVGGLQAQMQYAGYYNQAQIQQEGGRIQGLLNEADSNVDSVVASSFQIEEVFNGYRQSGNLSSKRRVREATNAALQSLPNWPQPY